MSNVSPKELFRLLPPRDRRRRKRILTLRNTAIFAITAASLFVLVSLIFEFRPKGPGQFGRLYERRTREVAVGARKPYPIIQETNISDQIGADPLLLEAARRHQYLGVTPADLAAMREAAQPPPHTPELTSGETPLLQQNANQEKARIEITGGPGGVYVKRQ